MSLYINSNVSAMDAYRNLSVSDNAMSSSLEKLSSGLRINRAADDAAGLSISDNLESQIGGLTVAVRNAQDGINVVQTADGALNETTAILQRMRDLAVQASNTGSEDSNAQDAANTEVTQLKAELDRIAKTTAFGGKQLLDGTYNGTFQVGANNTANDQINVDLSTTNTTLFGTGSPVTGFTSAGLGVSGVDLSTDPTGAIDTIDAAIKGVSTARSTMGAYQNRFQHTVNNLNTAVENLTASDSQIRDVDVASEMTNFTKNQILVQAGTAMLAQANQTPQSVLSLLKS
jgi:flagellin